MVICLAVPNSNGSETQPAFGALTIATVTITVIAFTQIARITHGQKEERT